MIIVTAKFNIKSGNKDSFILEAQKLISATRNENGCMEYSLYSSTEEEDILVMLEQWEDMDSLNKHIKTKHFKNFGTILEKFLTKEMEVKSYSVKAI